MESAIFIAHFHININIVEIYLLQGEAAITQLHLKCLLALVHSVVIGQTNLMARPDDVASDTHVTYLEVLQFTGQGQGNLTL